MHDEIKAVVGIDVANCSTCAQLSEDGDGYEYNGTWPVCIKYERMENLNSFPFKKEMKCWEPEFWASKFPEMIKHGEHNEILAAIDAFREACELIPREEEKRIA